MVSTPSLLDRTEIVHLVDGRREYLVPGAAEEAAKREAWQRAYNAQTAENDHAESVARRVREIVSAGPPVGAAGDALERHLAWLATARRQLVAAKERRELTADAASRHGAAKMELSAIESEVRLAVGLWAETLSDSTLRPDARVPEQEHQRRVIAETEPLARVADTAAVAAEVAQALVNGLETMLPFKRAEAVIARETPRLLDLLAAAVADITQIYAHLAALDTMAAPSFETSMALRDALGVEPPTRLVQTGKATLPSVRGRAVEFKVKPDPEAEEPYQA
jgi:hypothetical protein